MSLVPTMANALLNSPDLGKYDLSSMKTIIIGGAASSPELIARMEQAFGCTVVAGYGLTETAPVATSARPKGTVTYAGRSRAAAAQAAARVAHCRASRCGLWMRKCATCRATCRPSAKWSSAATR